MASFMAACYVVEDSDMVATVTIMVGQVTLPLGDGLQADDVIGVLLC